MQLIYVFWLLTHNSPFPFMLFSLGVINIIPSFHGDVYIRTNNRNRPTCLPMYTALVIVENYSMLIVDYLLSVYPKQESSCILRETFRPRP